MNIRPAAESDAVAITDLCNQLGYPSTPEDVARCLHQIRQFEHNALFVAEVDGRVAGWIHVIAFSLPEMDLHTEIGGLVVDEAHRSLGLDRLLVARAEAWAREHECCEVRVRCNVIRTRAHNFYECIGYENIKSQHTFRKQL
ncbi:MAG: N-acetyltransferase [Anaerolinea sp.]|nr:N-acetyltransferase [Anaerolinea sp.]